MLMLVSRFTKKTPLLKENKPKFNNINNNLLNAYSFFSSTLK